MKIIEIIIYCLIMISFNLNTFSIEIKEINYKRAGLINSDGSIHKEHIQNFTTGIILNVKDYGVIENGLNQSEAIQSVIDRASYGDEVYLPNGTYSIVTPLVMKSGVNFIGESKEKTMLIAKPKTKKYSSSVIMANGVNNILISKMTITSNFKGNYSISHKKNNPQASGPKYAIMIKDNSKNKPSYNITVNQVVVENFIRMGIRVQNSHDIIVKNSIFQKATDLGGGGAGYGISIQGSGHNKNRLGYPNDSRFNVVKNCIFIGPYIRHGVILQYFTHNNAIYDNILMQTKLDAIDLHGEDEYLNEIYNNIITDIKTGAGVGVGNSGATHDKSGFSNYIHHNKISNCREGIKVYLGSENTIIKNNIITDSTVSNAKGIYLQNAPDTIVESNIIKNNKSNKFFGIYLSYDSGTSNRGVGLPKDITITKNTFENCSNGIYLSDGENIVISNNIYKNITGIKLKDVREKNNKNH